VKRLALALLFVSSTAAAEDGLQLKAVETGLTAFEQRGVGYQSQASSTVLGPGSERLIVFEPQLLVRARQGERLEHSVLTTLDIVTAASPNAVDRLRKPDAISNASKTNQAGAIDWTASYAFSPHVNGALRNGVHLEENFRSLWNGIGASYSFAEDAATASASLQQIHDWFDRFDVTGVRVGRATRTTTSGNAGFTQILGPETVVHASYGLTTQTGELSNTWNSVPLNGYGEEREGELLPRQRVRHALVGRFAQWLPWTGALKGSYRFYADDWGVVAHTLSTSQIIALVVLAAGAAVLYRARSKKGAT